MVKTAKSMHQRSPWFLLVSSILCACGGGEAERISLGRPPVVVILLDALHAGHLSHLGCERETTPNLDALAAEGVSFTQALAPAPYTLATVSSILTGKLPDRHGLVDKRSLLDGAEVTLAETLAEAGYRTCAAVGNLNGSSIFACDQGFEEYVEVFRPQDGRSVDVVYGEDRYHFAKAVDYPPLVERFLADDDGRPLLLYLHILEPHEPYAPPEPFRARYIEDDYEGPFAGGDSATLIRARRGDLVPGPSDKEAVQALYDANLAHVDEVLGRIFEQLDAAGLFRDALVVVTSDHGEAFWQHGEQGHNTTLYDEMLHVPLIVRFPQGTGPAAGRRPDDLVSPMDLLPSLCDWLDLPLPAADLDGASLTASIFGQADPSRELILRSHHEPSWLAVRSRTRKTIVVREADGIEPVRIEHYQLSSDPMETVDMGGQPHAAAREDALMLRAYAGESARRQSSRGVQLSEAEQAMLRGLGYTDD